MTNPATPEEHLRRLWLELRDGATAERYEGVRGAIEALRAVGLLSEEQAELWSRRIATCPGHDDEGGRSWCAYCGTMRA